MILGLAVVVVCSAGYELRYSLLERVARYLVVEDKLAPSDAVYLLNGDFNRRPFRASELFRNNLVPRIIIARAEDSPSVSLGVTQNTTDLSIQTLEKLGVPENAIVQLRPAGGVKSTYDEARVLRDYVVPAKVHRIIIVTSEFHSRRSYLVFQKVLSGTGVVFTMSPVRDLKYTITNWWRQEDGFIACQNEYLKLLFYKLHYGI